MLLFYPGSIHSNYLGSLSTRSCRGSDRGRASNTPFVSSSQCALGTPHHKQGLDLHHVPWIVSPINRGIFHVTSVPIIKYRPWPIWQAVFLLLVNVQGKDFWTSNSTKLQLVKIVTESFWPAYNILVSFFSMVIYPLPYVCSTEEEMENLNLPCLVIELKDF